MSAITRTTVRNTADLTAWLTRPEEGPAVTYHIGNLAVDRTTSPALHLLAETVRIFAEAGAIGTSQTMMRLSVGSPVVYSAIRRDARLAPRSLLRGKIDAHTWRALQAVSNRRSDQSGARAIRSHLGCPNELAYDLMCQLLAKGLIEDAEPKGFQVSDLGRQMLM